MTAMVFDLSAARRARLNGERSLLHTWVPKDGPVEIEDFRVGDKVTWTNQDAASHTATGSSSGFDTGTISTGRSKSITFNAVGTYAYHCTIHPTMTGTVVVRASSAGNAPNTDTAALDPGHDDTWLSIVLATLGVVMLVGTLVVERLLRRRAT